ncbi:MAG: histidine kinase N-terminal 7TM domain-containing protein, partial [Bacillota bacterium]
MIDVLSIILFVFGLFFIGFFIYSVSKQNNSLSAPFSVLSLAIAIYIIGYSLELQAENLKMIEFFLNFEYFGTSFIPAFWFIVAYKYHYKKKVPIKFLIPIIAIAILTLFFRVTNDYHHLIYTNLSVIHAYGHVLAVSSKGLWYAVYMGYYFTALIFGLIIYFRDWRKCGYKIKSQSFWLFFSPLLPTVLLMVYLFGSAPLMLDLTPFGLTISACMIFIALFRYDFLELNEMIKDITFLEISEGILVVDEQNRLVDFNKAGNRFFQWVDKNMIG